MIHKAAGSPAAPAAPAAALDRLCLRVLKALDAADADIPSPIRVTVEFAREPSPGDVAAPVLRSLVSKAIEERVVIGIVLEPTKELNKPDTQRDVYTADEVKKAAYNFMQNYQNVGLQHQADISDRVHVILNWIALEDTLIGGQSVAKGTWLMGVRVQDDDLWSAVKSGEITGFSIGGMATRTPSVQ